jgi:hypothetical protein
LLPHIKIFNKLCKSSTNYICECNECFDVPLRTQAYIPLNKDFIFLRKFENRNVKQRVLNFYKTMENHDNVGKNFKNYFNAFNFHLKVLNDQQKNLNKPLKVK